MMTLAKRPLSPHLQVYKPQLTSVLSILHRATGLVLGLGTLLTTWWLIAAAMGPSSFAEVQSFVCSWAGRLILLIFSFALFYHLLNGIRHLFWDMGKGLEMRTAQASGWAVVILSLSFTILSWGIGYSLRGGI